MVGNEKRSLLRRAVEAHFDIFLTLDGNLDRQQNLSTFNIAVRVLRASSNRLEHTLPRMPAVLRALSRASEGKRTIIK
jgi:hypothetical protein